MKKRIVCALLALLTLMSVFAGCGKKAAPPVMYSENYSFSEAMARYMLSYTATSMQDELRAEGCDLKKPLSEQYRESGESFADYVVQKTAENMEMILSYSEAALKSEFILSEGMLYRAQETVAYLSQLAQEYGMSDEEYVTYAFGKGVTYEAYRVCIEMMTLCEGYDLYLFDGADVSLEDASAYADKNADKYLTYDCLRYTVKDKTVADALAAATTAEEFALELKKVSGINISDSDKNGIPDVAEYRAVNVKDDASGKFASEDGRKVNDTNITEDEDGFTVTMILTLPARNTVSLWDFRAVFFSEETAEGSYEDCVSLIEQIREKGTGEEGFTNIAYRYSENGYAYFGGLYSGVPKSGMPASSVSDWICDPARKKDDMTAVADGTNGSYMLYFLDGPLEAWLYYARADMKNEAAEAAFEKLKEDGTIGKITTDMDWLKALAAEVLG